MKISSILNFNYFNTKCLFQEYLKIPRLKCEDRTDTPSNDPNPTFFFNNGKTAFRILSNKQLEAFNIDIDSENFFSTGIFLDVPNVGDVSDMAAGVSLIPGLSESYFLAIAVNSKIYWPANVVDMNSEDILTINEYV